MTLKRMFAKNVVLRFLRMGQLPLDPNENINNLRYDRYESKLAYWVETDLEAEWEKTTSRSRRETAEFSVETEATDALLQATAPLTLDNESLAMQG